MKFVYELTFMKPNLENWPVFEDTLLQISVKFYLQTYVCIFILFFRRETINVFDPFKIFNPMSYQEIIRWKTEISTNFEMKLIKTKNWIIKNLNSVSNRKTIKKTITERIILLQRVERFSWFLLPHTTFQ